MKRRLNKYTCDRCGKSNYFDNFEVQGNKYPTISFCGECSALAGGHVCPECFKDFKTLAENFFDEVNKDE